MTLISHEQRSRLVALGCIQNNVYNDFIKKDFNIIRQQLLWTQWLPPLATKISPLRWLSMALRSPSSLVVGALISSSHPNPPLGGGVSWGTNSWCSFHPSSEELGINYKVQSCYSEFFITFTNVLGSFCLFQGLTNWYGSTWLANVRPAPKGCTPRCLTLDLSALLEVISAVVDESLDSKTLTCSLPSSNTLGLWLFLHLILIYYAH